NLYHSFEKCMKGKYQSIVDDLLKKGFNIVADIRIALMDAINESDDMAKTQLIEEMSSDAFDIVVGAIDNEYKSLLIK
ncbi:hypothetical protein, partial [Acinetobacter baumannii]|uniref:hypothetical protein n=1 Tax=Acinetobacter baumannii TaxID=470 RepID=UPI001BC86D51